ncbi:MAG: DUF1574 domain-containing protein [Leptospira sp.]|nr:DUF1574 domain-containing protein [Leptospira sp.]
MDILKNKYLLLPFLVVFTAFILDKIFLSENIQTYFSTTMSEINYMQKHELYEELKIYLERENRRKVIVYFGTSRALLFENDYIEKNYSDWTMFNFSVPGGTPDYALYWIERFKEDKLKPDFVLLDQSIEAYNSSAAISLDDVLTNGLSIPFVLRHAKYYSNSQISTLLAKRMFKTYHYRPKLKTIQARIKDDYAILKSYRALRAGLKQRLREGKGSAKTPGVTTDSMSEENLKKSSWGDFHSYLVPFRFQEQPMYFLGKSYKILDDMGIAHSAIWVRLSRPYFKLIQTESVSVSPDRNAILYDYWFPKIIKFQEESGVKLWNMNEDPNYNCDYFSDSGHMAPRCYKDYTDYIFGKLIYQ